MDDAGKPRNFSWVKENLLCACAHPNTSANIKYLHDKGVTIIVNLTTDLHLPEHAFEDLEEVRLETPDWEPPALEKIAQFVNEVDKAELSNKKVAVFDYAGYGRVGTVLSCYMMQKESITAKEAIDLVRNLRPGSVETTAQEERVGQYESI